MKHLLQHIEALIFVAEQPIKLSEIIDCLNLEVGEDDKKPKITEKEVLELLEELLLKYNDETYAFKIEKTGGGYQFLTKKAYYEITSAFLNQKMKRRLTNAAIETLAIIAYKQPIIKSEIEKIRGVNSDYTVQKLMEKELVEISGRSDEPGRPLLYSTSQFFMDYFGINDISDLPKLKEFAQLENEIGEKTDIETVSFSNEQKREEN